MAWELAGIASWTPPRGGIQGLSYSMGGEPRKDLAHCRDFGRGIPKESQRKCLTKRLNRGEFGLQGIWIRNLQLTDLL